MMMHDVHSLVPMYIYIPKISYYHMIHIENSKPSISRVWQYFYCLHDVTAVHQMKIINNLLIFNMPYT